jgi:formiminoglutamate deiminase
VRFVADHAWLGDLVERDVTIEIADGRFAAVTPGGPAGERLPGLVLPGLANAHSHAFHRALRGRTHRDRGSFWTWRSLMYAVAERLDPDGYHELARAVYGEMVLAGITCVGEFHYLHHGPDGAPYADPNAMGTALIAAARDAGLRITLLDTLYLSAGVDGKPLEGVQRRFGDGDVEGWSERFGELRPGGQARIGAAVHSVRAVPVEAMATFARRTEGLPVHVHVSEQRAENEACQALHGRTPVELLTEHGILADGAVGVHATHLTDHDVDLLATAGAGVCLCPTTERDLADGLGPARRLADAGVRLSLGSDSHAVIDPFEEARGLELHERLATGRRGHFAPAELLAAATAHDALGWPDAGRIEPGARADLVAVRLDSVRTAGCDPEAALLAATAADVTHVMVDGRLVVSGGEHVGFDVSEALRRVLS